MYIKNGMNRFSYLLQGHSDKVRAICLHQFDDTEGPLIFTGGDDKKLIQWNFLTKKKERELRGHTGAVTSLAIAATSRRDLILISGSADHTAIIWSVVEGLPLHVLKSDRSMETVLSVAACFLEGVSLVFTGGTDRTVTIWEATSGEPVRTLSKGHLSGISAIVVHIPTAKEQPPLIITGGLESIIAIWDLQSGRMLRKLLGHKWAVRSLALYVPPDSSPPLLISGGADRLVMVWDLATGEQSTVLEGHDGIVTSVGVIAPRDSRSPVIVSASDHMLRTWDLTTGAEIRKFNQLHKGGLSCAAAFDIGACDFEIVTGGEDGMVAIWDLTAGELVHALAEAYSAAQPLNTRTATDQIVKVVEFYLPVDDLTYPPMVLTGHDDCSIALWDLFSGKQLRLLVGAHRDILAKALFWRAGEDLLIFSASWDSTTVMWSYLNAQPLTTFHGHHTGKLSTACLIPGSTYGELDSGAMDLLVTGGWDHLIVVWNLATAEKRHLLLGHKHEVQCVKYLPPTSSSSVMLGNSNYKMAPILLSCSWDLTVRFWDLISGLHLSTITGGHTKAILSCELYYPMLHEVQGHVAGLDDSYDPSQIPFQSGMLITGGFDNIAVAWDMATGQVVRSYVGHKGIVIAIAIARPNMSLCGTSFLFTGSDDCTIMIWGLMSGHCLRRLWGHTDTVLRIDVVPSSELTNDLPLLVSGSFDGTCVLWDCMYSTEVMPPLDSVRRSFELDGKELNRVRQQQWPRITALSEAFGNSFWLEHYLLFALAIKTGKTSFCCHFRSKLPLVCHLFRPRDDWSILQFVLDSDDVQTARILFSSWAERLNQSIDNSPYQRLFHPCYFFETSELLNAAKKYPADFCEFICSVHLVKAHCSVKSKVKNYNLATRCQSNSSMVQLIECCEQTHTVSLWDRRLRNDAERPKVQPNSNLAQPVTPLFLPLHGAADIQMLQAYVDVCEELGNVDIFNSDAAIVALSHAWEKFGYDAHVHAMQSHFVFVILFAISCYSFRPLLDTHQTTIIGPIAAYALQGLVLVGIALYFRNEFREMLIQKSNLFTHFFGNIWDMFDGVFIPTGFIGTVLRLMYRADTAASQSLLAVASIVLWSKCLYYMRAFPASGPLVAMTLQIALDMRFLVLILALFICGNAQAFWLMSYPDTSLPFGTIPSSFLNVFLFMLGNFDSNFQGTASPALSTLILVIFLMFMSILMLNLLIALMGQSFSDVNEKGLAQFRFEQATVILGQMHFVREEALVVAPCVHVLRYSTDLDKNTEGDPALHQMKRNMAQLKETIVASSDNVKAGVTTLENAMNLSIHTLEKDIHQKASQAEMQLLREEIRESVSKLDSRMSSIELKLDLLLSK